MSATVTTAVRLEVESPADGRRCPARIVSSGETVDGFECRVSVVWAACGPISQAVPVYVVAPLHDLDADGVCARLQRMGYGHACLDWRDSIGRRVRRKGD